MDQEKQEILDFWFKELSQKDWYTGSKDLDEVIKKRFLKTWEKFKQQDLESHLTSDKSALATIICLDQFPRNMFRRSKEAFSSDYKALEITKTGINKDLLVSLNNAEKQFFLMPLMHSESLADQLSSIQYFKKLNNENILSYAMEHHVIIARFGRFPHRNSILNRISTPEEQEYILSANSYGQ